MSQLEEINVRMISLHNSRKQIQQINDLLDVLDTKLSDLWRYKMSHINESYTVTHKTVNFFMSISCNKCSFQKAFYFWQNGCVVKLWWFGTGLPRTSKSWRPGRVRPPWLVTVIVTEVWDSMSEVPGVSGRDKGISISWTAMSCEGLVWKNKPRILVNVMSHTAFNSQVAKQLVQVIPHTFDSRWKVFPVIISALQQF